MPAFRPDKCTHAPPGGQPLAGSSAGHREARRCRRGRALTPSPRPASVPPSRPPRGPFVNAVAPHVTTISMMRFRSVAGALLLAAVLAPALARAQGEDARVLPRGWIELRGGGFYTQFDSRFGPGGTVPLGEGLAAQLQTVADRVLLPFATPARAQLDS